MSPSDDTQVDDATAVEEGAAETPVRLNLNVKVDSRSACERHVTVTVPREDIDRYYDKTFSELMPTAQVPGFRQGRAPRKLIEARFRKEAGDQVKGALLMDSMTQVTEDAKLSPISEPDFDPDAIEVPAEGAMTFEFDIEVRPEFDLPTWNGLSIERPVRAFGDADVERQLQDMLARRGSLVPFDGPAEPGDYVVCNLRFVHDGQDISKASEETIRIRSALSFRDGTIEKFDKLMKGAKAGDVRKTQAKLTEDAPNEALRGKAVEAEFEVLEVKKLEVPTLTPSVLEDLGGFESEDALREAIKASLERRLSYEQQRRARAQVLAQLTVAANWDLPPGLLQRQSRRELQRAVLELQRSGFSDSEIRAHENELRQNSRQSTSRALKEHFILERIAEDQKIEADPADYDLEVALIAQQTGDSARRVRAQLEKRGLMDTLHNQIIERKVIELILSEAKFKDVPYEMTAPEAEAIDQSAGGGDDEEDGEIPEAKSAGEAEPMRKQQQHD